MLGCPHQEKDPDSMILNSLASRAESKETYLLLETTMSRVFCYGPGKHTKAFQLPSPCCGLSFCKAGYQSCSHNPLFYFINLPEQPKKWPPFGETTTELPGLQLKTQNKEMLRAGSSPGVYPPGSSPSPGLPRFHGDCQPFCRPSVLPRGCHLL